MSNKLKLGITTWQCRIFDEGYHVFATRVLERASRQRKFTASQIISFAAWRLGDRKVMLSSVVRALSGQLEKHA